MGLCSQAAADAKGILNDATSGAGRQVHLYDPTAPTVAVSFVGFAGDIAATIDPDTGDFVAGRRVTVALSLTDIRTAIVAGSIASLPDAVPDTAGRPWVVEFDDNRWKVAQSMPDRTVDMIVLELEAYQ